MENLPVYMQAAPAEIPHIITLSLYSKISKNHHGSYQRYEKVLDEADNINRILMQSSRCAEKYTKSPPQVVLRFCLISKDGGEIPLDYVNESHAFFETEFKKRVIPDYIENFIYLPFSSEGVNENKFINGLESVGSYIDINKIKFIIENKGKRHLQMDTNTYIPCWEDLYKNTFLKSEDSYGCSRCSLYYIAAHNKIVYLGEDSLLPDKLSAVLDSFYDKYKDESALKVSKLNAIYDYVWGEAMFKLGYTHRLNIADRVNPEDIFSIFPAAVAGGEKYTLNPYYLQAHHQSWNPNKAELDLIHDSFTLDLSDIGARNTSNTCIDPGFTIGKAAIETLFTTYTNIPLIDNYKTFHGSELRYANSGYKDFFSFLNKQNLKLDEYIINQIVGEKFLSSYEKGDQDIDDDTEDDDFKDDYIQPESPPGRPPLIRRASDRKAPEKSLPKNIYEKKINFKTEIEDILDGLDITLDPIALDNFCKIKIYLGYTVSPQILLKCTSQATITNIVNTSGEKSEELSGRVPPVIQEIKEAEKLDAATMKRTTGGRKPKKSRKSKRRSHKTKKQNYQKKTTRKKEYRRNKTKKRISQKKKL
tara:strand:- start:4026 stop:5792 length:1767 start_codon:yes stop_codon:yes gene_type:complete